MRAHTQNSDITNGFSKNYKIYYVCNIFSKYITNEWTKNGIVSASSLETRKVESIKEPMA